MSVATRRNFAEHYWQKNGVNGGAREFEMTEQTSPTRRFPSPATRCWTITRSICF